MAMAKVEFFVQMTCQNCVEAIEKSLSGHTGIEDVNIDLENERVIVKTTLPTSQVKQLIESSGRRAVLQGLGSAEDCQPGMISPIVIAPIDIKPEPALSPSTLSEMSAVPQTTVRTHQPFRPWEMDSAVSCERRVSSASKAVAAPVISGPVPPVYQMPIMPQSLGYVPMTAAPIMRTMPAYLPHHAVRRCPAKKPSATLPGHVPMQSVPVSSLGYNSQLLACLSTSSASRSQADSDSGYQSTSPTSSRPKPLTVQAKLLLEEWYEENSDHPYPSPEVVDYIACKGDITPAQVKRWLSNKRIRCATTLPKNRKFMINMKRGLSDSFVCATTAEDKDRDSSSSSPEPDSSVGRGYVFSCEATQILNTWFEENREDPYPSKAKTDQLALQCKVTPKQVRHWLATKRICLRKKPSTQQQTARFLISNEAYNILNEWFEAHKDSPYPSDTEKEDLAEKAEITPKQVRNWFARKRRE